MKRYPQISVRHPGRVLLGWMLVVMAMGFAIAVYPQLGINPTFKSMIMPNDPDRAFDAEAKQLFGEDEVIVIAVENPRGVFDIPTLTFIDRITREVKAIPGVRDIYSLTDTDNIRGDGTTLLTEDLITELPKTKEDLARIEREAFENPIYLNTLVAADKKVASINVELASGHTTPDAEAAITKEVYAIVARAEQQKPVGVKTYVTGFPVASYLGGIYMLEDMAIFGGASCMILAIIMFLVFRNWQGVAFTMMVVMVSTSTTYGLMSLFGVKVTMPLSSILGFLTAIGMEYATYVGFAYRTQVQVERGHGRPVPADHRFIVSTATIDVRGAVILSAITTVACFGSMLTNKVPDLQTMGLFLAIGAAVAGFAAITIIPAFISLFPFTVPPEGKQHGALQRIIDRIGHIGVTWPRRVLACVFVVLAAGLLVITQLSTDSDGMQYFKESSEIRKADEFVRQRMAGPTYLQAVVKGGSLDTFKEPDNLRKLAEVQAYAETLPHVTKAVSHADHIRLLNKALKGGGADQYVLPTSRQAVEQYLLLHNEPDDFRLYVDHDYKNASILLRLDTMSSSALIDAERDLEAYMSQKFPGFESNVVGTTLLAHRAFHEMSTSMLVGLGVAAVLVWLVMVIGLGSFKLGTLSLLPNLAPAILVYSFLPLIGRKLDPPTAITGAIAIGIALDDTTHFFKTWMARRKLSTYDASSAVTRTLSEIGLPMVMSSFVLAAGFAVMMFSRYGVLVWMGVMLCVVAVSALLWDLFCTPAMLRLMPLKRRVPTPDEVKAIGDFKKVRADERRTRLADYSDDEIRNMFTSDFLALSGKTVIGPGGSLGTRRLLVELDIKPHHKVLEIGTGPGATTFTLARDVGAHVTGVDTSEYMIEQVRKRAVDLGVTDKCTFVHLEDPNRLPFPDSSFDVVLTESVAMHTDTDRMFTEVLRVLKPGGKLGLHEWSWIDKPTQGLEFMTSVVASGSNPGETRFFSQKDWEERLKRHGFGIRYANEHPYAFFALSSMRNDEGTWGLVKMYARVLSRGAAARKLFRIVRFLSRYGGAFGFTVAVAEKPSALAPAAEAGPR
jgi:hypothetical protein